MITPHSQFVVTQSAINVAMGERYKVVIDEVILFAQGVYGEDSGYTWMDANLKDRLLALPRAKELAARQRRDRAAGRPAGSPGIPRNVQRKGRRRNGQHDRGAEGL